MTRSLTCLLVVFILASGFAVEAHEQKTVSVMQVSDTTHIPFDSLIEDLQTVRMVFVGELHDEKAHHLLQLRVIQGLEDAGVPTAVGLEMFRHEDQPYLDQWVSGSLSEEEFVEHYYRNWNLSWSLYRPIFIFAREKQIPLVGLNVPAEITRQVAREGFSSLPPEDLTRLPSGVRCEVGPEYETFIRRSLGAHAHAGMNFTHFCEAQMLWDTAMAWHALEYLRQHPERTMVVLAGSGHAWRHGIPRQVERQSDLSLRVLLPEIPGRLGASTVTPEDADYLLLHE
jgi:uncharacterized iron-regulated protein